MIRSHLLKLHQAAHEVHGRLAKTHGRIADLHMTAAESYSKSAAEIREDCHKALAEEHQDLSDHHAEHARFHASMAKAFEARGDEGLPRVDRDVETYGDSFGSHDFGRKAAGIRPDGVRGVLPTAPDTAGLKLIQRVGGPSVDIEATDPALRKLLGTD